MIFQAIIEAILYTFSVLFSVFPAFPQMPQIIVDGWSWFMSVSNAGTGLIVYFLSKPLYIGVLSLVLFMTTFEYIYHFLIRFLIFRIFMGIVGRG